MAETQVDSQTENPNSPPIIASSSSGDNNNNNNNNNTPLPWGRLVSLSPKFPNFDLCKDEILIGRSAAFCQYVIDSPTVSGKHCRIFRDTSFPKSLSNVVFVEDMSTNGTFINGELIGRGSKILIHNNIDISLTPKKYPEKISFMYQDCKEQAKEEEGGPSRYYDLRDVLGTGNFATVRMAVHKETGVSYAIKIIDKQKLRSINRKRDALMDEVNVLAKVHHENIISIKEIFQTEKMMYLVLELVTGGELFDRIVESGKFSEGKARALFIQMLNAVKYLHSNDIVHRDLKPENILLASEKSDVIKLSDFGLSRILDQGAFLKTMCGTPQYVAPEVLTKAEKEGYGKAVDLWSLGVILYILLCGYPPFEEGKDIQLFDKVKNGIFRFSSPDWDEISDCVKDLINHLLTVDASKRYTVEQALEHPWIKEAPNIESNNEQSSIQNQNQNQNQIQNQNSNQNENQSKSESDKGDETEKESQSSDGKDSQKSEEQNSEQNGEENDRENTSVPNVHEGEKGKRKEKDFENEMETPPKKINAGK